MTQLRERALLKQIHSRMLGHNSHNQLTVLKWQAAEIEDRDHGTFEEQSRFIKDTVDTLLGHRKKATDL